MKIRILTLTRGAMFAAILALLSPVSIQVGPVPITLSLFAVLLASVILNRAAAVWSVVIYLLLGVIGLPVFAMGKGGAAVLTGATGGYIWSYIPMAVCVSLLAGNGRDGSIREILRAALGCLAGTLICYICGTAQFAAVSGRTFSQSLGVCVLPFLLPDLCKCAAAAVIGVQVRKRL